MKLLKACIEKHPQRKSCVQIIRHSKNKGLPAARNSGLAVASGEYVFHCDSDDFADKNMLEVLYQTAAEHSADIVWCDWFLSYGTVERLMKQPSYDSPVAAVKGMLGGAMKFNVWNKLVRRSLYVNNVISFPDGYGMGEDLTMIMLFAEAKKVIYVPAAFYHYVKANENAFSQTYSDKHLYELCHNVGRIETFIKERFGNELDEYIAYMKLEAKFPLLLMKDSKRICVWRNWYSEANTYILKNKQITLRNRLLQWAAWKNLIWLVLLYSMVFNRVVYGRFCK